jgi:hypothetical protein
VYCEGPATAQVDSASRDNGPAHLNLYLGFLPIPE